MNSELNNLFWQKHAYHTFNATTIALYFYLQHLQDVAGTGVIRIKNAKILADLDISFHTLQAARQCLSDAGLLRIDTTTGSAYVYYEFTTSEQTSEQTSANFAKVANEVTNKVADEVATSKQTSANFAKVADEVTDEVKEKKSPIPPKKENNNTPSNEGDARTCDEDIFVPPTIDQVREFVSSNSNLTLNVEDFFYYYQQSGWKLSSGNVMKDWRAAVYSWQNRSKQFEKRERSPQLTYHSNTVDYEQDKF